MALAHLGDRRIDRLDDEAQEFDNLVRYCAEFYTQARQEVLAAQRWTFANFTQRLSARRDQDPIGYGYAHQLPSDLMRLLRPIYGVESSVESGVGGLPPIFPSGPHGGTIDRFKIVGNFIWTDHQHVALEYVRDVENPSEWTPHFRGAVARLLASFLAGPLADNPGAVMEHKRIYETVDLPNAQYYDAVQDNSNENSDKETRLARSPSLNSRYDYRYGGSNQSDDY